MIFPCYFDVSSTAYYSLAALFVHLWKMCSQTIIDVTPRNPMAARKNLPVEFSTKKIMILSKIGENACNGMSDVFWMKINK